MKKSTVYAPFLLGISTAAFVIFIPDMILHGMTFTLLAAAAAAVASIAGARYAEKKYQADCFTLLRRMEGNTTVPWRILQFLLEAVLLVFFAVIFYLLGQMNEALDSFAVFIHAEKGPFFLAITVLLFLLSLPAVTAGLLLLRSAWSKLAWMTREKNAYRYALHVFAVLLVLMLQYWSLETVSLGLRISLFHGGVGTFFCNMCLLLLAESVLALLLGNSKRSLTALSVLIMLWSIANYYTIQFHGSPLFFSEFQNAGTAMAVIGGYRFRVSTEVLFSLLMGLLELFLISAVAPALLRTGSRVRHLAVEAAATAVFGLSAYILIPLLVSQNYHQWMAWSRNMNACGFLVYSVHDLVLRGNTVTEPDGYDESLLPQAGAELLQLSGEEEYPDIILILNESFFDLNICVNLETDVAPLEAFYSVAPYVARGYAVVHGIGSGTNDSEFELLMSKSRYLLTQNSPFTFLNDEQLSRSVVSYLEALGYETTAMHQFDLNYNRNNAYPAIGFDHIYLGVDQPNSDVFAYDERNFPDAAFYEDLKLHYDVVDLSRPQLFYLMTFQNHGGYQRIESEWDTVHVLNDIEIRADIADEYLSSIRLSSMAFRDLTEYYSHFDRKTIVCMVGDHGPAFLANLPEKNPDLTDDETYVEQRTVPFIIWANYETSFTGTDAGRISMVDLVPIILRAAGLPLSTFYSEILALSDVLPVRMSNGIVMDRTGNTFVYPEDAFDSYEQLTQYYYMEYNSLLPEEEFREELFMLPAS